MKASNQPFVHGACPGALQPMAAADGLIVRVRPPLARLTPLQAMALAELAEQYGTSRISLTSRANLQIRGVGSRDHPRFIASLKRLDLVDVSVDQERRRNLVHTPFWVDEDASHQIAVRLVHALKGENAPDLPVKFGFAVDCGSRPILLRTSADIRFQRDVTGALICLADGMKTGARISVDTAVETAMTLARWFLDAGGAPQGRGRMASLLASGAVPPSEFGDRLAASGPVEAPAPGEHVSGFLVAPEFGHMTSQDLHVMAQLGALRLTPWRMVLIEGVGRDSAPDIGLQAGDPRLKVFVCTGAPGCTQALSPTLDLARSLAARLPYGESLHVSGCAKGCAHPAPASFTLTATAPQIYSLIRDGKASDEPVRRGLRPDQILTTPEIQLNMPENDA